MQERPIHPYVTNAQAAIGDTTDLCSFVVTTDDGYELVLYRISRNPGCNADVPEDISKGPLLFVHGFASDSSTWFTKSDPERDHIGLQYAEEGYDVFYANLRGSAPSRTHSDPDNYDPEGETALL